MLISKTVILAAAKRIFKSPKSRRVALISILILVAGIHYKMLRGERNELRAENKELAADNRQLESDLALEKQAIIDARAERAATQKALDKLRKDRANDPEAQEWATEQLPPGEILRLCEALPEMEGCKNTIEL